MAKLAIQSYERNGYNDSDGYMIYLDTETLQVENELFWTTRGYMPADTSGFVTDPAAWTPEQFAAAKQWLKNLFTARYRRAENYDLNEPSDAKRGDILEITEELKNAVKTSETVDCFDCNGSGNWINPNKPTDVRECFACKGTGKKTLWKRAKGWKWWPAGTTFKVVSCQEYGTFYAKGYNKPGRFNRTAVGFTEAGEYVRAPLTKVKMAPVLGQTPLTDAQMDEKAQRIAEGLDFVSAFHGAWCDHDGNYIARVKHLQEEKVPS